MLKNSCLNVRRTLTGLMMVTLLSTACGQRLDTDAQSQSANSRQAGGEGVKSYALINEQITSTIAEKMQDKCRELFSGNTLEHNSCNNAATALSSELDFNYIRRDDGSSAFVFLNRRLHALLAEPKVTDYLNEVQRASLDAIYAQQNFNLWDLTKQHCSGNEDCALERIAVLFQDGAETAAQKKFLLVERHPLAFVVGQTLEALEMGLKQAKIAAYPAEITNTRAALYHYYVPRFLARRLSQTGHSKDMAMRLPFVFNTVYELRQIQKSENPNIGSFYKPVMVSSSDAQNLRRFIDKWNRFDELYSDLLDHLSAPLNPFDASRQTDNLDDLYLGYMGSLSGTRSKSKMPLIDFAQAFSTNPRLFIKN